MALTIAQLKQKVLLKIGDHDNSSPAAANIDLLWADHGDKATPSHKLQFQYTLLDAIDLWLAAIWNGTYVQVGLQNTPLDAMRTGLQKLRDDAQLELEKLEKRDRSNLGVVSGQIERASPIAPRDIEISIGNASSRLYRGDPYYNNRRPYRY